jgi:alpha-glucosidase
MQWDASPNAGFAAPDATPWLPMAADAEVVNVAGQAEDPDSILTLTRRLIELRRKHPVLRLGDFETFGPTPDGTYAFRRLSAEGRLVIALNLTGEPRSVPGAGAGRVLIGTHRDRDGASVAVDLELRPNEAVVIELDG